MLTVKPTPIEDVTIGTTVKHVFAAAAFGCVGLLCTMMAQQHGAMAIDSMQKLDTLRTMPKPQPVAA